MVRVIPTSRRQDEGRFTFGAQTLLGQLVSEPVRQLLRRALAMEQEVVQEASPEAELWLEVRFDVKALRDDPPLLRRLGVRASVGGGQVCAHEAGQIYFSVGRFHMGSARYGRDKPESLFLGFRLLAVGRLLALVFPHDPGHLSQHLGMKFRRCPLVERLYREQDGVFVAEVGVEGFA